MNSWRIWPVVLALLALSCVGEEIPPDRLEGCETVYSFCCWGSLVYPGMSECFVPSAPIPIGYGGTIREHSVEDMVAGYWSLACFDYDEAIDDRCDPREYHEDLEP